MRVKLTVGGTNQNHDRKRQIGVRGMQCHTSVRLCQHYFPRYPKYSFRIEYNLKRFFSDEPDAPDAPEVVDWDEDHADVTWKPPKHDGGIFISEYIIEKKDNKSINWTKVPVVFWSYFYFIEDLNILHI